MRQVFILVNGILTLPGDSQGWTDRGVTWINSRTEAKAEKFEYACGAISRRLRQQQRVRAISRMCDFYRRAGYEISLVGHSNGCDLIARVIALNGHHYRSVHLFAAATDWPAFALALSHGRIGQLNLYVSAGDRALRFARWSRRFLGWAGLGYGSLGLGYWSGFCATPATPGLRVVRRDTFGHSTWFERGFHFETTMRLIFESEYHLQIHHP